MNARQQRLKEERARELTVSAMRASPRWTPEMDARLVQAAGKYSEISELAQVWRMSIQTIQARWHVLRVG